MEKAASNLTAQEIYNFANRIQTQLPSNPNTPAAVSALDRLGDSLQPVPPAPPIDPIFRVVNKTYEQVFGHDVRGTQGWWSTINMRNTADQIEMWVVPFVAPPDTKCFLNNSNMSSKMALAITESPGGFTKTGLARPTSGSSGWSTGAPFGLKLTPGKTYYLCMAGFVITEFLQNNRFVPSQIGALQDQLMSQASPA